MRGGHWSPIFVVVLNGDYFEIVEKENKIGTEEDILDLWTTFQTKAFGLVSQANKGQRMPAILWTNTMTEKGAEKYVSKEDYIIQVCIVIQLLIIVIFYTEILTRRRI